MKVTKTVARIACEWWSKKIKIYNKKHEEKRGDEEIKEIQNKFVEKFTSYLLQFDYEGSLYFDLNSSTLDESFIYAGINDSDSFFNNNPLKMKITGNSIYVSTNGESYTKIY